MSNKIIEQHYKENYDNLVRRIFARIKHHHMSEDVVQEAYARAIKYFKTYDPKMRDFDAWFNTILNNSLKKIKNEERERGIKKDVDNEEVENPPPTCSEQVVTLISQVNEERTRTILNMYYILGFKTKDIAEYMSLGHSNVRMIISRYKNEVGQEDV